jgi:CheY-like chemotaxis protein
MKILLVEDSRFLRITIERNLVSQGYEVVSAGDGEEALRLAVQEVPDLILLDMMLPKMSGQDVLRILKLAPITARIPVVVLSGLSQKNEAQLVLDGAAAYFEKSDKAFEKGAGSLLEVIESVIAKSGKKAR